MLPIEVVESGGAMNLQFLASILRVDVFAVTNTSVVSLDISPDGVQKIIGSLLWCTEVTHTAISLWFWLLIATTVTMTSYGSQECGSCM